MIRIMSELPPRILGFEACGRVTAHDYETVVMPEVERAVAEEGRLRMLYYLGPTFEGFSSGALLDDARLGLGHVGAWERIALVTDDEWVLRTAGRLSKLVPRAEVRVFPGSDLAVAREWLEA